MKAYLIDPTAQTVEPVEYDGNFKSIYKFIECDTFDCVRFNEHGDGVFIDDEGLISGKEQRFFQIKGYPQPLAGKGFVLGCDTNTGESAEPHVSLEWLRENVVFVLPLRTTDGGLIFLPMGKHKEKRK